MAPKPFTKVLVANRGEIACRVLRTCHAMGLETVAVYSAADARAAHVRLADEAVHIGPAPSSESYLSIDRIVAAARLTGAQAVHPGYGFLAENADFAGACEAAGLVFIGPSPAAIRAMGSKREARRRVAAAGVPVVPGYDGDDQSAERLAAEATRIGFPVLIKASAGGGGKGMQVVHAEAKLQAAIESARRVAESAFADGSLLLERYIERPRHVEIQILGDAHGNLVHLYERECSIQRRHQKVVEETPSTALDEDLRQRMGEAAVTVGRTVDYTNAGTVELILAPDGAFYFLEVNTRLQVEHPVTECLTGLDLVREQIRIARGEALGYAQADIPRRGAAVECRLYAEDPARGFLPSTGTLLDWHIPAQEGLRVDAGVEAGDVIGIHYDPLLAKVITWGEDRAEALQRMTRALRGISALGLRTNRQLLLDVIGHPAFQAGEIDTHFIERHQLGGHATERDAALLRRAAVAAAMADHERRRAECPGPLPHLTTGYRNNPWRDQAVGYAAGDETIRLSYRNLSENRFDVWVGEAAETVRIAAWSSPELLLEHGDGVSRRYRIALEGERHHVHAGAGEVVLDEVPRFPEGTASEVAGGYRAPMPGKIVAVPVAEGAYVEVGAALVVLEAMKMEQTLRAAKAGIVESVHVAAGDQVDADAVLIVVADA